MQLFPEFWPCTIACDVLGYHTAYVLLSVEWADVLYWESEQTQEAGINKQGKYQKHLFKKQKLWQIFWKH